jgi:hypothetical protein
VGDPTGRLTPYFGARRFLMGAGILGISVLIRLERTGDLPGQTVRH